MKIVIPKETIDKEKRAAIVPQTIKKLVSLLKCDVEIEKDLGKNCYIDDEEYIQAGAKVNSDRKNMISSADIVLRIRKPPIDEILIMKKGSIHISFLDPFNEKEIINAFEKAKVSAFSLEMMPRTTLAQKMDTLSSQANLAGYISVIIGAEKLQKILPMMTTPSGTITPSRVFIIGVGVAGLQAIATARRLGARVEAFDTREVVEEQVKSLGAKFLKIDLGKTDQTKQGYAKALTEEQLKKQKESMTKTCSNADIIITTAQVFGRKAPMIIDKQMINKMKKGTVIIDMAVENGGNVEGSKIDEIVEENGVRIIGLSNLPSEVSQNASEMFSSNLYNFLDHFWDKEKNIFSINQNDEIIKGCLITHNGALVNEKLK